MRLGENGCRSIRSDPWWDLASEYRPHRSDSFFIYFPSQEAKQPSIVAWLLSRFTEGYRRLTESAPLIPSYFCPQNGKSDTLSSWQGTAHIDLGRAPGSACCPAGGSTCFTHRRSMARSRIFHLALPAARVGVANA